jgi:tRNA uridine 5-carboxymethylaminomethyl modification enzyme
MYSGQIQSIGPRYCPSIEDKVVRFSDKPAHQIFLEPEGENTLEYYCNGISTSLPQDVQTEIVHSIAGLENADIMRYGYAVEYDIVPARQLYPWLETRTVENLFHAGQINGTSGYEEAAAQGIMAGINAALRVRGDEPFVLGRDEAYVGVLLDDLVTEDPGEPYRMFTSRAEYRLLLRQDNADRRLMKYGWRYGLLPKVAWEKLQQKERQITETIDFMEKKYVDQRSLVQHLRRPEYEYDDVEAMSPELQALELTDDVKEQINIQVKYEGYINRQEQQVIKLRELEDEALPADVDYSAIDSLSNEARGKLDHIRPMTVGQASRISGVTPADISVLMVYFKGGRALPRKAQPI